MGDALVVTNGDQTDTIVGKGDFHAGCMARAYEPDAPNFTPRISCVISPDGSFELSILKRQGGNDTKASDRCVRAFFSYEGADAGAGYFISTYQCDGSPCRAFPASPSRSHCPQQTRSGARSTPTTRSRSTPTWAARSGSTTRTWATRRSP